MRIFALAQEKIRLPAAAGAVVLKTKSDAHGGQFTSLLILRS